VHGWFDEALVRSNIDPNTAMATTSRYQGVAGKKYRRAFAYRTFPDVSRDITGQQLKGP
jgi:hypothetical protein